LSAKKPRRNARSAPRRRAGAKPLGAKPTKAASRPNPSRPAAKPKPAPAPAPPPRVPGDGPRHFLFKSEPTVFSIDHLAAAPAQTTCWEGVRNYQARNLLRDEVRKGDLVLFWHSSADPAGAAGVAEVARDAYPDPAQFDPKSPYHDPGSPRDAPRWLVVDVRFVRKFPVFVPVDRLQAEPSLAAMDVLRRGNRLSIQRVRPEEFAAVLRMAGAGT
jgi:predicted RNA-binding protein with PUA-like domain